MTRPCSASSFSETTFFFRRGTSPCYAKIGAMSQERKTLDATAVSVMVLLTASWGFQQVTIKLIAADVSLVMQAAIRSIVATGLLIIWAQIRGIWIFARDGTLAAGIAAGGVFAL